MGNKKSLPASEESRPDGFCVLEIVSAEGLPNMDAVSLTDAYVICQFTSNGKVLRNASRRTLSKNNSLNPIFHSYQAFPFIPDQKDVLLLNVFDKDIARDDFIGSASIDFASLSSPVHAAFLTIPITLAPEARSADSNPKITIRLVTCGPPLLEPQTKEIIVIRHGESKWNDAQSDKDVKGMVSQVDHELTADGVLQAVSFNERWKALQNTECDPEDRSDLEMFLAAGTVYASPLTRATQTALLTCEDHPVVQGRGIVLLSNLREVKNFGSFDTVGQHSGGAIEVHVRNKLIEAMGETRAQKAMATLHSYDAQGEWWTPLEAKETKEDVDARFSELFSQLRYGTRDDKIILVGHSHFFRHLVRHYISPEYKEREPEWTQQLYHSKLDNGAGMRLTLQWDHSEDPMCGPKVSQARLIFGSKLIMEGSSSLKASNAGPQTSAKYSVEERPGESA